MVSRGCHGSAFGVSFGALRVFWVCGLGGVMVMSWGVMGMTWGCLGSDTGFLRNDLGCHGGDLRVPW